MTVETAAQALAFVKKHGVVTVSARVDSVPCFVEAVAGEPVRGSWWGHPKGKLIFALAEGLEDSGQVLVLKLLEGLPPSVLSSCPLPDPLPRGGEGDRGVRRGSGSFPGSTRRRDSPRC